MQIEIGLPEGVLMLKIQHDPAYRQGIDNFKYSC